MLINSSLSGHLLARNFGKYLLKYLATPTPPAMVRQCRSSPGMFFTFPASGLTGLSHGNAIQLVRPFLHRTDKGLFLSVAHGLAPLFRIRIHLIDAQQDCFAVVEMKFAGFGKLIIESLIFMIQNPDHIPLSSQLRKHLPCCFV